MKTRAHRGICAAVAAATAVCLAWPAASEPQDPGTSVVRPEEEAAAERRLREVLERAGDSGDVRARSRAARALADHLSLTGRVERAAALLADMAVVDAALGRGDRDHLTTEYRLSELWLKLGRGDEAIDRIEDAGQRAVDNLGPADPLTLRMMAFWALAYMDQTPDEGRGEFLRATEVLGDAYETARTRHPDDPALMFDILSAYAEVLLKLQHTSMALPAVQDMVELMDRQQAGDPGQQRRMRARLGMMVLEERFVQDALIILRQAAGEIIAARDTRSAQAELREASPFRAMVQGAWIRSFDPEFGLHNDASLNRYDPELMGDFGVD